MPPSKPPPDDPFDIPELSESVRALARRGVVYRCNRNRLLIQEGEIGDTMYIILAGKLRAFSASDDDKRIEYGTYGPGDYVGEMGLDGGRRSASVEAVETTRYALITRATLEEHLREHPTFAFELLARVIRRARAATQSARMMALFNVQGRLQQYLDSIAVASDQGWLVPRRIKHHEIAAHIGCGREMVSRVLKEWERDGHLSVDAEHRLHWRRLPRGY